MDKDIKVISFGDKQYYFSAEDAKGLEELRKKKESWLLWGPPSGHVPPTPEQQYRNHLKWAWIEIGMEKELVWVHNENMKAYKDDGEHGIKEPLEEIKYDKFTRWATTFDL